MKALALLAVAALTASADAQVRYFIQSSGVTTGPFVPVFDSQTPPNVEIDIGVRTDAPFIQIVDLSGPITSLGTITIRGANAVSGQTVSVAICDGIASPDTAFGDPDVFRLPGLRNLGGIIFLPPLNNPTDTSLLRSSRVSVTVRGDITGDIVAGQIYRVDALRNNDQSYGGNISGTIRAVHPDGIGGLDGWQVPAIAYVRAGWSISGDIIADGGNGLNGNPTFNPTSFQTWGSARTIIVGPSTNAVGLTGDVLCENGAITTIMSSGQIGSGPLPAQRSQIKAGMRISHIASRAGLASSDPVLDKPIYADIQTSLREAPMVLAYATYAESSFSLLETEGDFVGSLDLLDLFGLNDSLGAARAGTNRKGIFVGGDFIGDINVKYSYQYGDMIARSFRGRISIGQMLKGSIVAVGTQGSTDPNDGAIFELDVGYGTDLENAPRPNEPGISPSFRTPLPPPFEGASRDVWYTVQATDLNIRDSVVRAENFIGSASIKNMSRILPELDPNKYNKARIEAPVIGSLSIGHFDSGVVWSGRLNSPGSIVTNTIADDFAQIGTISIGCMGPKADIWARDWDTFDISGDLFGEVHVPEIQADRAIRVFGKLGDLIQAQGTTGLCYAEDSGGFIQRYDHVEDSPRGMWLEFEPSTGIAPLGRIRILDVAGLEGQIILDAANTTGAHRTATHWRGDVEIGTGDPADPNRPAPFIISADSTRASTGGLAPLYATASTPLGGGAVGLAPFALYDSDCEPINNDPNGPTVLNSEFSNMSGSGVTPKPVVVKLYGPVRTNANAADSNPALREPVRVYMLHFGNPPPPPTEVTQHLTATLKRGSETGWSREIELLGKGNWKFGEGWYLVVPVLEGTNRLYSDLTVSSPSVLDFDYVFELDSDCNLDGQPDTAEEREICGGGCPCHGDYDKSGGVDGDDIAAFFNDWTQGLPGADVDCSGGIDGDDVPDFFADWLTGCL